MNKENCALRLVDEIILYYDARSKKHQLFYVEWMVCMYHAECRGVGNADVSKYII